jgi:hypothetical protein
MTHDLNLIAATLLSGITVFGAMSVGAGTAQASCNRIGM